MDRKYTVIESLVGQGKVSNEVAEEAIALSRKSGKPSLFHMINDCSVNPDDVTQVLLNMQEDGKCICPKCDGAGSMPFGKGDGECYLCNQAGVVPIEVAFGWLNNNQCIPGF